jgi:hypothetical protein
MQHIGIYGADRGFGSTLLAAHLYYYLREHGVHCGAASRGFRDGRPLGLTRWADISRHANAPLCKPALLRPLGFGVHISDLHAELFAAELGENACESWVIPIRDEASLERGLQIAPKLQGGVLLVWNGAADALRRHVSLPVGRIRVAASALPESDLLRRADEAMTPIWRLRGGAGSTAGRAMIRVLREILDRSAATLDGTVRVIGGQPPAIPACGHCSLCNTHTTHRPRPPPGAQRLDAR